jgi:hypothetical protein
MEQIEKGRVCEVVISAFSFENSLPKKNIHDNRIM